MHLFHQMKKVMTLARNQRRRQNPLKERKKKKEDAKTELLTSCVNVLKEPSAAPAAEPIEEIGHFAFHIAGKQCQDIQEF